MRTGERGLVGMIEPNLKQCRSAFSTSWILSALNMYSKGSLSFYVEVLERLNWCRKAQAKRVLERPLIDSSP
jgi:hypothetical protein